MHNIMFITVAHLNSGAFIRKCIVNYSYCDLTPFIYEIVTLIVDIEISYVDNQDKFLPDIEI